MRERVDDDERAHDVGRVRPRVAHRAGDERRPHEVDHLVRERRRDQLTAQAMATNRVAMARRERSREVAQQHLLQERIVDERRCRDGARAVHLRVCQQDGQLGTREAEEVRAPAAERFTIGQTLERAIQQAFALERGHQLAELE